MMRPVAAELQPELWVENTAVAVRFYQRAFAAVIEHRVGGPDDSDGVVQLAVSGARFWVAGASESMGRLVPAAFGGATARFLLVVVDPAGVWDAAVAAGASATSEVAQEHGWLVG